MVTAVPRLNCNSKKFNINSISGNVELGYLCDKSVPKLFFEHHHMHRLKEFDNKSANFSGRSPLREGIFQGLLSTLIKQSIFGNIRKTSYVHYEHIKKRQLIILRHFSSFRPFTFVVAFSSNSSIRRTVVDFLEDVAKNQENELSNHEVCIG